MQRWIREDLRFIRRKLRLLYQRHASRRLLSIPLLLALLIYYAALDPGDDECHQQLPFAYRFSHAVNSRALLEQNLLQRPPPSTLHVFETDVATAEACICHPPACPARCTFALDDFLRRANASAHAAQLVLKLDFKDEPALHAFSTGAMGALVPQLWLNADVLTGPAGPPPVVSADALIRALESAHGRAPRVAASLSFTVGLDSQQRQSYTRAHVDTMLGVARDAVRAARGAPPTFAIASHFVRRSVPALRALLEQTTNTTLSIWNGVREDEQALRRFVSRKLPHLCHRFLYDIIEFPAR